MICYIPGCICYGSENFGLGTLHDVCVGLAGATLHFCSVASYTFDYRSVDGLAPRSIIVFLSRAHDSTVLGVSQKVNLPASWRGAYKAANCCSEGEQLMPNRILGIVLSRRQKNILRAFRRVMCQKGADLTK